jgi:hypothetical protein
VGLGIRILRGASSVTSGVRVFHARIANAILGLAPDFGFAVIVS